MRMCLDLSYQILQLQETTLLCMLMQSWTEKRNLDLLGRR